MNFLYTFFMRRSKGFTYRNAAKEAWRTVYQNGDEAFCYLVGAVCSFALGGILGWVLKGIYAT